ncbi:MAG: glycosyltransferase family 2 protein [Muribaculaceae bacterium]|nr:glycosyltransferase family 2 protein [Muribaculaceae bacterium]
MENTRTTPPIAVVILNWNGAALLREFLPKVVATSDPRISRIIVADNGSSDDSLDYVRSAFPDTVGIIQFSENHGFAEGYNKALEQVRCYPYTVLLNSDVATTPGWDTTLLTYMEAHPEVAACQPKILAYKQPDTFEYAGAAGGYIDSLGYPYCRGRIFDTCEKDSGQYDTPAYVAWASGACLMVRTQQYLDAGGLDPKFFAHMEEIDLCWRLRLAGYRCAAVPEATVYHLGGGSLAAGNPRKTYLNFRNNLLMLHKNLPEGDRGRILLLRRLLDTAAWAKFMLTFDFANAAAVWRAHRHFAKMRAEYTCSATKNLLATDAHATFSVVAAYYLRRKRTYSALAIAENASSER